MAKSTALTMRYARKGLKNEWAARAETRIFIQVPDGA